MGADIHFGGMSAGGSRTGERVVRRLNLASGSKSDSKRKSS